jgi:uncharacterized damage-inducible protein DinB
MLQLGLVVCRRRKQNSPSKGSWRRVPRDGGMANPLCGCLRDKIHEQFERAQHLIREIPAESLDWTPPIPEAWPIQRLLNHLLDCAAGFCAVLSAVYPEQLAHFQELKKLLGNKPLTLAETGRKLDVLQAHLDQGFQILDDRDLEKMIPTVFVEEGVSLLALLLGNLEHFINHKYQLLVYLKLMGCSLGTRDVYHFHDPRQ